MNGQVIYNVPHAIALGWPIALYIFITGLSAGAFFLAVLPQLTGLGAYKRLARVAAVVAPIAIVLAPIFLVADLEQPARFYRVLIYQNGTSSISYGSYLLPLYGICAVLYAYFLFRDDLKKARIFGMAGVPLAFALEGYTGLLLGIVRARELWNSALMPVLFLTSAIASGIALVMLISAFTDGKRSEAEQGVYSALGKVLGGVVILELFMVVCEVLVMLAGQAGGREAAQLLLTGSLAPWFLGVEILLGAVVPAAILLCKGTVKRAGWQALASVCVLLGALAMRFVLVLGGQMIPLS